MAASRSSSDKPILIKKYGNRRLYDTSQSKYITLEDLAEIIRDGTEVKVIEASTNRDLTRQVLTQVILEHQESLEMIPIELLHAIIKVRGTMEQAPFSAFLAAVTRQFVEAGNLWTRHWSGFLGAMDEEPVSSEPPDEASAGGQEGDTEAEAEGEQGQEPAPSAPDAPSSTPKVSKDLSSLRRRMDALLNKLDR